MSRWFRHYAGMMRDEKLVRVALRSGQSIERVIWVWGAILESAAEINDGGRFDLENAEAAYFLRADEADIVSIRAGLEAMGRVRNDTVVKWSDRQFQSDTSAVRQRRYREKQRAEPDVGDVGAVTKQTSDGQVTSPSRHRDAPELETELDTKTEKKEKEDIRAVAVATRPGDPFEEFWKAYPKRDGANPKAPARKKFVAAVKSGVDPGAIIAAAKRSADEARAKGQIGTPYVPQALTWLNQQRWGDYAAPPERGSAIGQPPSPDLPSDEELRRKYGQRDATANGSEGQSTAGPAGRPDHAGELLGQGGGDDHRALPAERPGDPPRRSGMRSLGEVFRQTSGLAAVVAERSAERDDRVNDGSGTVAGVVRH